MNPPESNEVFDLACAFRLGRILGGHDLVSSVRSLSPLPKRGEPVTLVEIKHAAVAQAIKIEGTKRKAAARLQVSPNTLFGIERRGATKRVLVSKKIVQLRQVA